jgi:hypothetical protein
VDIAAWLRGLGLEQYEAGLCCPANAPLGSWRSGCRVHRIGIRTGREDEQVALPVDAPLTIRRMSSSAERYSRKMVVGTIAETAGSAPVG